MARYPAQCWRLRSANRRQQTHVAAPPQDIDSGNNSHRIRDWFVKLLLQNLLHQAALPFPGFIPIKTPGNLILLEPLKRHFNNIYRGISTSTDRGFGRSTRSSLPWLLTTR